MALSCLATVLLLDLLAVCVVLHERLHHDAGQADHQCAVTLFSHGKAHFSPSPEAVQKPGASVAVSSIARVFLAAAVKYALLPSRAPPFLPA